MDALLSHFHDFIIFSETKEETRSQIAKFAANSDFPQVVGATMGHLSKLFPQKPILLPIFAEKVSRIGSSESCRLQFKVYGH